MKKIVMVLLGIAILILRPGYDVCFSSDSELPATSAAAGVSYSPEHPPRFEDFRVVSRFRGHPAPVNLASHKEARMFRTRLREGAARGPNFAGYNTIVTWGCGTSCQMVAVVDAGNGKVSFAPFTTSMGASYQLDSRLFVANPPEELKLLSKDYLVGQDISVEYYVWENKKFRLICKFPVSLLERIAKSSQASK
jgi:hypothetical protein